ncbi:hypothetical protein HY625_02530 [Candidatus Uhrbacteria bacterium]|nr:hypothetical protein [Candidatus Uhrbacteria bacterium]
MMHRHTTTMLLFLLSLLAGNIIVVALFIVPTVLEVRALRQTLATEQAELEKRYQEGLLLKRLREDWEKIQSDAVLLDQAILTKSESIAFITRFEALAGEHRITHRLTLPPPGKAEGASLTVPFALQWEGDWTNLLQMLVALEQEPYYLPIDTVHIVGDIRESAPISFTAMAPSHPEEKRNIQMDSNGTTVWKNE